MENFDWYNELREVFIRYKIEDSLNYKPKLVDRIAGWILLKKAKKCLR